VGEWSLPASYQVTVLPEYTLTASCGLHGTIDPQGAVTVLEGTGTNFTIQAEKEYHVASILLDGVSTNCAGIGTQPPF